MTKSPQSPPRRGGWWLFELAAGLALASLILSQHLAASLGAARARRRRLDRRFAYFFARGLAAELAGAPETRPRKNYRLTRFFGIQRDLARLALPPRTARRLAGLRVDIEPAADALTVRVTGPGLAETRREAWR